LHSRTVRYARHAAALICAAALGALLFSVQVATMVFREMGDDRLTAGRVAGRAFVGAYGIAGVAALVATAVAFAGRAALRDRVLALAMAALAGLQLFWIAPAIVSHGTGWPWTFASLHATGGALHLAIAVVALALTWRFLADPPATIA
jgi:hypothetical protein